MAILRGGWVGHAPQIFGWPLLGPPVLRLISRSSSFDWHIQQITFSQQNFKGLEDFLATVPTMFTSLMLGLIGFIIGNQLSLQRKITMQERHLCWPPYFFPWPRSAPPSFFIRESPLISHRHHVQSSEQQGTTLPSFPVTSEQRQGRGAVKELRAMTTSKNKKIDTNNARFCSATLLTSNIMRDKL